MIKFKEKHHDELRKSSSGPTQNELITITSKDPHSEYHFERKFNPIFLHLIELLNKPEEELMDFIEQQHQESKNIEEELVTIKSKIPYLSEATKVTNEISVKLPPQLLIYKITTSFEKNFDPLIMNRKIEVTKFEPKPTFEKTTNEIKYRHLKMIVFAALNLSEINLLDKCF